MDLHIHISTSPSLNLCVHIHLQHIPMQEQSNTVKCLCHGSDIIGCLEEHVYSENPALEHSHTGHSSPEEQMSTSEM